MMKKLNLGTISNPLDENTGKESVMSTRDNNFDGILIDEINLLTLDEVDDNNILFSSREISKTLDFIEENDIKIPCVYKNKQIGYIEKFYLIDSYLYADIIITEDNMENHLNDFKLDFNFGTDPHYNDFADLAINIKFKRVIVD